MVAARTKQKTKKAIAKRFWLSGAGDFRRGSAYKRHNLRRRAKDPKREARRALPADPSYGKLLRRCAPYGL